MQVVMATGPKVRMKKRRRRTTVKVFVVLLLTGCLVCFPIMPAFSGQSSIKESALYGKRLNNITTQRDLDGSITLYVQNPKTGVWELVPPPSNKCKECEVYKGKRWQCLGGEKTKAEKLPSICW
jgi:hypothetical protein